MPEPRYYVLLFPFLPYESAANTAAADELRLLRAVQLQGSAFHVCSWLTPRELLRRLVPLRAHTGFAVVSAEATPGEYAYLEIDGTVSEAPPGNFDDAREGPLVVGTDDEEYAWMFDIERLKRALAGRGP